MKRNAAADTQALVERCGRSEAETAGAQQQNTKLAEQLKQVKVFLHQFLPSTSAHLDP